jgi:hypothetical protein
MTHFPLSKSDSEFSEKLRELGRAWAYSPFRPRLSEATKAHWDNLLNEWATSDLPLVIRKGGAVRESVVKHSSGREVIIADNSPAQWSFSRAFDGQCFSLIDIRILLEKDSIPFTFATKLTEKSRMAYKRTLGTPDNVNKRGWKLCHIIDIGLNTKELIEVIPLVKLVEHFKLLIAPSNHFLIPLIWGGLGEVPEIIEEVATVEGKTI